MSKIFFCHFWFCAICGSTKSCLILKIIPPKTISKILSFESISVLISQKLRKLEQKNMCRFFCPLTVCFKNACRSSSAIVWALQHLLNCSRTFSRTFYIRGNNGVNLYTFSPFFVVFIEKQQKSNKKSPFVLKLQNSLKSSFFVQIIWSKMQVKADIFLYKIIKKSFDRVKLSLLKQFLKISSFF